LSLIVRWCVFQPSSTNDLVRRDFSASRPNELWVADITYLRT
jgi:putative transposase